MNITRPVDLGLRPKLWGQAHPAHFAYDGRMVVRGGMLLLDQGVAMS